MPDFWRALTDVVTSLHPSWVEVLADSIAKAPSSNWSIPPGLPKPATEVEALAEAWRAANWLRPLEVAAALRAASATRRILAEKAEIQLVWTGPEVGVIPVRHTEAALLEVIRESRKECFIVSFVATGTGSVEAALREAVGRGVSVRILLELTRAHGGTVDVDSAGRMKAAVPQARFFAWGREAGGGSVHAKCAVADGRLAFITSANLTTAALERNMELGVLLRGGHLPERLAAHLAGLVEKQIVSEIG